MIDIYFETTKLIKKKLREQAEAENIRQDGPSPGVDKTQEDAAE